MTLTITWLAGRDSEMSTLPPNIDRVACVGENDKVAGLVDEQLDDPVYSTSS